VHVKALDGARGIAASLVAVDHVVMVLVNPPQDSALHHAALALGSFGVGLFFLISGFVIPQTLRRGAWDYTIRRAFRLYPVAFFGAVLALVVDRLTGGDNGTFLATASLVGNLVHENTELLLPIYWTLTVEAAFYVLAGLIGGLTRRGTDGRAVYYLLIAVCVATIVLMKQARVPSDPIRVGALVILCCLPMLFVGWFAQLLRTGAIDQPLFLIGAAIAFVALSAGVYPYFSWELGAPTWLFAFAVFAIMVFGGPRTMPATVSRPLTQLGTLAFPIYVVHIPISYLLRDWRLPLSLSLPGYVVGVIGVALLMHWAVEKPGIAVGKRLAVVTWPWSQATVAATSAPPVPGPTVVPFPATAVTGMTAQGLRRMPAVRPLPPVPRPAVEQVAGLPRTETRIASAVGV
jgi:peptidoglycan/LPS O-acetylase OafA/YrhL